MQTIKKETQFEKNKGHAKPNCWPMALTESSMPGAAGVCARMRSGVMGSRKNENRGQEWRGTARSGPAPDRICQLVGEVDREEDNAFRERRADDGLGEDRTGSSRVATDCLGGLHANETHAESRAEGGEADVDAARHFCQDW